MDQDKHSILSTRNKRWIELALSPSWVSLSVIIVCSLGLFIGVVFTAQYQGTRYQQQVREIRTSQANPHYSDDDVEFEGLEGNTFMDVIPLFILWGIVGVIVYLFAINIVQALQHAAEFKSELGYINADRNEMLQTAFMQLGIRLAVGIIWIVFVIIFFNEIIPYSINSALAASATWFSMESFVYGVLCVIAVGLPIHLHTIFLRLLLLKPRIFSKALYIS